MSKETVREKTFPFKSASEGEKVGFFELFDDENALENLNGLLEIGSEQGFVTTSDILEAFPQLEGIEQIEFLYSFLEEEDIEIELEEENDKGASNGYNLSKRFEKEDISHQTMTDLFFSQGATHEVLTGSEEVELFKRIELGNDAQRKIAEEKNKQEFENLIKIMRDGQGARKKIVESNIKLVISVAKRYRNRGIPFLDLIQEGNIGLLRAVPRFEWRKGYRFSTYATWWIRQSITRAICDKSRTIRLPVHQHGRVNKMFKTMAILTQELNRTPTDEELAERMNVSVEKIRTTKKAASKPVSLETPVGEEYGDSELGDLIENKNSLSPSEEAGASLLRRDLEKIFAMLLNPIEERVLSLRFGLKNGETKTLEELGEMFGVTRERIRQIEKKALLRIKGSPNARRKLRDYLLR